MDRKQFILEAKMVLKPCFTTKSQAATYLAERCFNSVSDGYGCPMGVVACPHKPKGISCENATVNEWKKIITGVKNN